MSTLGTLCHGRATPTLPWNHSSGKPEGYRFFYWTRFAKVDLRDLSTINYFPKLGQGRQSFFFFFNKSFTEI